MAQRGREHQGLALGAHRQLAQQEAQVLDEAEVEHAVGLVEHADLAGVQVHHALAHVIDEAARGGDDHVGAALQDLALLVVIDTAVNEGELQAETAGELLGVLVDLDGQFAGRRQDHRARVGIAAVGQGRTAQQAIHGGDQEGQGLARAGLGLAGDIATCQGDRQGHGLDGSAAAEASGFKA